MDSLHFKPKVGILVASVFVVIIALLPMLYWIGYIALGTVGTYHGSRVVNVRVYSYEWQEYFFRPAARVESALTAGEIETAHRTK